MPNKEKKKSIRKSKINLGKWIRVIYSDIGARDGLVIEKDKNSVKFFDVGSRSSQWIEFNQIVAVGNHLQAETSGL